MLNSLTNLGPYGVLLGGLAAVVLGLVLFVRTSRRGSSGWVAGLLVLLGLGGAAVTAALLDFPRSFVVSLSCLAGAWGLGWALRTSFPTHLALAVLRTLGRPQVQALTLLVGGLAVLGAPSGSPDQECLGGAHVRPAKGRRSALSGSLDKEFNDGLLTTSEFPQLPTRVDLREESFSASTDGGSPVALFTVVNAAELLKSAEQEERLQEARRFALSVVRTAPASADSNCHGWVFAGGRFCVMWQDVERILADNGYKPVSDPQAGDLVVYRDASGAILHTGKVRVRAADGLVVYRDASGTPLHTAKLRVGGADALVLVESKWGHAGRFLHAPADQPYSPTWAFYRARRGGHLLRGLEKAPERNYPPSQPIGLVGT
ncbi:MAG: hypothetical protein HYS12_02690 [Planctomycetes bacterium]|nr:hypothetical protein [Planctomycetota bacterium]